MSQSRSNQRKTASTQGTKGEGHNIELQTISPHPGAQLAPPQTRPLVGFIEQHHCLLHDSHTLPIFPDSLENQHLNAPDFRNHHKRSHSSDIPTPRPEAASQDQRRHSNSSQKSKSGGRSSYNTSSNTDAKTRNEHTNGVPVTSKKKMHTPSQGTADANRAYISSQNQSNPMQPFKTETSSGDLSTRTQTEEPASNAQPVVGHDRDNPRPEDNSYNSGEIDWLTDDKDNNYEHLEKAPSPSRHVPRPNTVSANTRPPADHSARLMPSRARKPSSGAKSPMYDSCPPNTCTLQVRPQPHPFLPPKRNQHPDIADDIIELQSDIRTVTSPEEKQNKSNMKKEVPKMTEVPNTNFAIACMVALCFNLPFGVLAMYFSLQAVKAFQDGRAKLGERRSRWSIVLSLLGITITTVIISSVVLYTALQGQKRISRQKSYGTRSGLNL